MSFQAYLDNIKAKTGKTPEDFRVLAAEKGLTQYREVMAWLKADYGLGHGHANTIAHLLVNPEARDRKPEDKVAMLFRGNKVKWHPTYDDLLVKVTEFGPEARVAPTNSYISLLHGNNKFGIVQPASAAHMDIGIKLKGAAPTERFEAAGSWNAMVTHRVRISDPQEVDAEVLAWLKQAFDAAA